MKSAITMASFLFGLLLCAGSALAGDVTLSVAASMKDLVNEVTADYARSHPGVRLLKNYGASGALAKQIENGAPADVYISANLKWMAYLKGKRLVDNASDAIFAYNTVVFAGDPGKARSLNDLTRLSRIAIGSPTSVPAGEYAMKALKHAGLAQKLADKLVMAKDVRACLMYAEQGDVDGAFVYRTDALLARRAKILFTVPQNFYPRVTYPMALTLQGANNRDAVAFYSYLKSSRVRPILEKYGFTTP